MDISVSWHQPMFLNWNKSRYDFRNHTLENIMETSGVYIFGRTHGKQSYPLYIGKTDHLRRRLKQHFNSVSLMQGLHEAPAGQRFLLVGEIQFRSGQDHKKVLSILERATIEKILGDGHDILNVQGTKRPSHTITFKGNRVSQKMLGRTIKMLTSA
ncbi:GIY-YIG nuclease family protein [Acidiphilium sp. AL]|uniref:GIY-YIG nuclease family protein n=1 Tax=Acidiphilium sp. AL TaxID=2871704 RepID=UPI0021CAEAD0|nr:GIY-YIG nuclease family protein [Acidiphilium sp. AL]MCU4159752.1 GIY-YIG nuclease family protein [Acidiphilium sp. AL]